MPAGPAMSNNVIYLPNEPLGKQGGMEKATHQLACLLRDSGHNVSLLCQQKNRLNVPYRPPVPLIFIPQKLNKKEKRNFINDLIRQKQTELIIDQTEGGIIGKYGIFKNRKQIQSNKIKIFGMKGEYNTDTAGIIDYTNNTYGVAYLHENETIKLGSNTGWYAGLVQNRFDFKDIGGSEENTTMGKLGIFKTMAFDNNGSLTWKISGEGMFGYSQMDRKFLVVDEIFGAESTYTSYGVALRNEISKDIRLTERTSLKPYGSLAIEYGRFSDIKEKTGEMRLEVEGNDYYSIKPEVGVEYKYKQPLFLRSNLTASLGIAYENDLGKVNDAENRARVGYTDADYFNLRGEKENRTGNGKADLKIGIENSRVGLTLDLGYDTKGENVRGGMGLRIIY